MRRRAGNALSELELDVGGEAYQRLKELLSSPADEFHDEDMHELCGRFINVPSPEA